MTTDNRTNEPTEAQVEAAVKEYTWNGSMRAALVAAQEAAPQDPAMKPEDMSIMNGWLVESAGEHTCGAGIDGWGHEPGCGYVPLINLAEIPGYPVEAAAAMDRVNRLHRTVLRGNSMLGEELEAWCVHCNIPSPCHTMQALGPVLPSSTVDEGGPYKATIMHTSRQAGKTSHLVEQLLEQGKGRGIEVTIVLLQVDEDALAEVIRLSHSEAWREKYNCFHAHKEIARAVAEWLKGESRGE